MEERGFSTPCWIWAGYIRKDGYGSAHIPGTRNRNTVAHRLVYEEHRGPIPAGLVIDHLCRVKACVNPDHLETVPQRVNVLRGNAGENLRAAAKLTAEDKAKIKRLRATTSLTYFEIADLFGVSYSRVGQIARGEP